MQRLAAVLRCTLGIVLAVRRRGIGCLLLATRGEFTVLLPRYIRQYNKLPRTVKWKYADPSRHISTQSVGTGH